MTLHRLRRIVRQRLRALFKRDAVDADLKNEFTFHFEQLVRENIADGMTGDDARFAAHRSLGNIALLEEECRDQRHSSWLYDLWHDARYGARMLRKNPGFTIVAIASLALGIGANTSILGVMDRVLRGDLSIPNADHLVVIRTFPLENPQQSSNASVPDYFAWKEQSRSFEVMGASLADQKDFGLERDGTPPERVMGQGFSPSLFATLGVAPMLGRVFTEEESVIGNAAPVIVISNRLWQRRFGGDPSILQKQVHLNGQNLTVIGVMPPEFRYPNESTEYWVPLPLNRFQLEGSARYFMVTARLRSTTTAAQAQSEMDAIASQLARDFPNRHRGWGVRVNTLRDYWFGWTKQPMFMLEGAVLLVLFIACANVATLLLARGSMRKPEFAMRLALGAGRARLLRQLLTESILLSLLGGAASLLIAIFGLRTLVTMTPPPAGLRIDGIEMNFTTVGMTLLFSGIAGVLFGIAPALTAFSTSQGLREASARSSRHRVRGPLVVVQIALALVLLVGCGLMINSFVRLIGAERNFDPRGVLSFEFRIPLQQYLKGLGAYRGLPVSEVAPPSRTMKRVYDGLRSLPGAESVAGISFPPVNSLVLPTMNFSIEGRPAPQSEIDRSALSAVYFIITPGLFETIKTPFVRGRDINDRDTVSSPWVAIINEAAARRFWPGENPIGKRFTLDAVSGEQPREVVGIVRDVPLRYVRPDHDPVIYVSFVQQAEQYRGAFANMFGQMTFLIRTPGDPLNLIGPARNAVAEVDPDRPIASVQRLDQFIGGTIRDRAYYAFVLGVFALTATLLAAIGIYGVIAYSVAQRTREIGIRMALGATAREIVHLIGGRALLLLASGLAFGLAGSAMLSQFISSQLWGVSATDPLTFAGVSLLLVVVGLSACLVPLRRAVRVDPTEALRVE